MNERIRELFNQSKSDIMDQFGNWVNYDVDYEKFAELIVRECINEIHAADVGDLKGKSYYLDKVAEHLEKHFEVEA